MVKELYLARHGETIENLEEIVQGQLDGKLSERGKEQARILGKKLRNIKADKIYSSDLGRAKETTDAILEYFKDIPVEYNSDLRERSFGNLQGKNIQEVGITDYKAAYLYDLDQEGIFADSESLKSIDKRINRFIQKILKSEDSVILAVGHGWTNSYLINKLLKEDWIFHDQDNASVHYFKLDDNGKVLEYKLNNQNDI